MNDILTWVYILAIVLAGGFVIYLFGALPMMIIQKKQVAAYRKLASLYGFEIKNDRVKLLPNWPTIKGFYDKGLWTIEQVHIAVEKGKITAEEYKTITGQDYTA